MEEAGQKLVTNRLDHLHRNDMVKLARLISLSDFKHQKWISCTDSRAASVPACH
jgi:hypothetical protein